MILRVMRVMKVIRPMHGRGGGGVEVHDIGS
jgi:hypothetical protein